MTRSTHRLCTIFLAAAAAACGESTPPLVATTISAKPGAPTTAEVGTTITPAAIVSDQNGSPLSGVTVTFTVTGGGGSITGASTTTTDASGVAAVSGWTLGTTVGPNTLSAKAGELPAVVFPVTTTAAAPAAVAKVTGDNTLGSPGIAVTQTPTVRVTDAHGNRVAGAAVTFAIASGGGSLTGGAATTNGNGDASLGTWTLGASPGSNTVTAAVTGIAPVTFTATAMPTCTLAGGTGIALGNSTSGSLAATDCRPSAASSRIGDVYTFTLATQTAVAFTMTSSVVHPYLAITDAAGVFLGETVNVQANALTATIRAILPAGSYAVMATGGTNETGAYNLSAAPDDGPATGCALIWTARGIATSQTLVASDCILQDAQGNQYYGDRFGIFLAAGSALTVDMASAAFDAWLDLADLQGNGVAVNDDASANTLDARIVFTASASGYYQIFPNTAEPLKTGAYQLTIAAPAPGPGFVEPPAVKLGRRVPRASARVFALPVASPIFAGTRLGRR